MKPMERSILSREVSEQLKQYIITRQLQPGDQLPTERELVEVLEVSRSVVREALGNLETLGIIRKQQGKGIFIEEHNLNAVFEQVRFIWEQSSEQMEELIEFRVILELAAIDYAVEHIHDEDILQLERIVARAKNERNAHTAFMELDYQFHSYLLKMTKNDLFFRFTDMLNHYFHMLQREQHYLSSVWNPEQTLLEHAAIIDALRNRDHVMVKKVLRNHLRLITK